MKKIIKSKKFLISVICLIVFVLIYQMIGYTHLSHRNQSVEDEGKIKENINQITDEKYHELESDSSIIVSQSINNGTSSGYEKREFSLKDLPYQLPNAEIQILSFGNYTGPYLENGKDEEVENICSIQIKNTSKQMIQYGEIILQTLGGETVEFVFTSIPANSSVVVLEKNKKTISKQDSFLYVNCKGSYQMNASLHESVIQLNPDGDILKVKNISEKEINNVYIYYKYKEDDLYYGGITYRISVGTLKANEEKEIQSYHYDNESSEVLMVDYQTENK